MAVPLRRFKRYRDFWCFTVTVQSGTMAMESGRFPRMLATIAMLGGAANYFRFILHSVRTEPKTVYNSFHRHSITNAETNLGVDSMALKLIATITGHDETVKVYHDTEWDEYSVRMVSAGTGCHTGDKEEALAAARFLAGQHEQA